MRRLRAGSVQMRTLAKYRDGKPSIITYNYPGSKKPSALFTSNWSDWSQLLIIYSIQNTNNASPKLCLIVIYTINYWIDDVT